VHKFFCFASAATSLALSGIAHATEAEIFLSAGRAQWSQCGSNGCWRQPPLPSQWQLHTNTKSIGLRIGDFEITTRDLGSVSVRGTFVADADYDSQNSRVREGAHTVDAYTRQETSGLSVAYAPRFRWRAVSVAPEIGILGIDQKQYFANYAPGSTAVSGDGWEHNAHRITPMVGVKVAVHAGDFSIGAGFEAFWRPRYVNSLAGGGESKVGLTVRLLQIGVAL